MRALHAPKPYQRKDRVGVWTCDGKMQLGTGRSRRIIANGTTKREAQDRWIEKANRARQELPEPTMSAAAYMDRWAPRHGGKVRPATVKRYESDMRLYLKPWVSGLAISEIRRADVEDLVASLRTKGLRSKSIRHVIATLGSIMTSALQEGLIHVSPTTRIHIAEDEQPRQRVMVPPPEMLALLDKQAPSATRDLLRLLTVVPLRLNEVRGLYFSDITPDGAYITLTAAATKAGRPTRQTLKTSASRRTIPLPPPARQILAEARMRHAAQGLESPWIFDRGDGAPPTMNQLHGYFANLKERHGLPKGLRIHDLRAGMATYLGQQGVAVATIQLALGHSDPVMTMQHYTMSNSGQVSAALQNVWVNHPAIEPPPESPPTSTNGADEEAVPNYGMVAFRAGSDGGERGIRTLDGVAPKPHFQCGAIDH